jgi:hypothetical protein
MDELEDLKQCSPDLGDISLIQYMGERHVLQPYGEDRPPIGAIVSRL